VIAASRMERWSMAGMYERRIEKEIKGREREWKLE
jgi:hypothetical protein